MPNSNVYIKSGIWRKTTTPVKGELNLDAIIAAVSPPSAPSIMIAGTGTCSTMRDGSFNSASGLYSTVSGGYGNTASNVGSTVSGGRNNTAYNSYSIISGGIGNMVCGNRATVGGGDGNTASGFGSTVSGGISNTASGLYSGILGGTTNTTAGFDNSFIIGSNLTAGAVCTTYVNNLCASGGIYGATKSFVIPHPTKPTMTLQYGVLEGPEHSVYVRGRLTGINKITLPEYWINLVHEDTITVHLTPIGDYQALSVKSVTANEIEINGVQIDCFYSVYAERKDIDKLIIEKNI